MNNIKSFSIIDFDKVKGNIHIVGVGAMGSMVCEHLVRLNLASKIIVYDMDTVEEKNLNNQAYLRKHIGMRKVDAMKDLASMIDEDATIRTKFKKVERLRAKDDDVVILCIDNFKARASIIKSFLEKPLLLSGGVNSHGGNVETVRGVYDPLAEEYNNIPETETEYGDDVTACGSPISIYHRIRTVAGIVCDELIKNINNREDINTNVIADMPNVFLVKD